MGKSCGKLTSIKGFTKTPFSWLTEVCCCSPRFPAWGVAAQTRRQGVWELQGSGSCFHCLLQLLAPISSRKLYLPALGINLVIEDSGVTVLLHRRIKMVGLCESRLNVLEFSCVKFQDVAKTKSKLTR